MANILGDNTVIPSYLGISGRGQSSGSTDILNDVVLRFGEVKKIVYPDDSGSYSKKILEYEVEVQYREGNGIYATTLYRGVTASSVFGGIADFFRATYRADTDPGNQGSDIGNGSKVLLLCLSGDQQKAIILGGLQDPNDPSRALKSDGHNLFFEFNGARFEVNKDGEITLTFRGATKANGDLSNTANPDAEGTNFNINKDGDLLLSTSESKQLVRLNHKDKKIEIVADEEWNAQVSGDINFDAQEEINFSSNETFRINGDQDIVIKGAKVLVGAATDNWIKGSTFRRSQQAMHTAMKGALVSLNAAGTALNTAGTDPTLIGLAPIAAGGLQSAGAAIHAAASALTSAISTFESGASTFLSKNKTD